MSVRRSLLTAALGALLGAGPALAAPAPAAAPPNHNYRQLRAVLDGRQEVPGPGDRGGWGTATVQVWADSGRVCYSVSVRRLRGRVTEAHIHFGRRGYAGGVEAELDPPVRGYSDGCTRITSNVASQLVRWPGRYYVNVHTTRYPDGAVRGQLSGDRDWDW
jgi:hypothetical protein